MLFEYSYILLIWAHDSGHFFTKRIAYKILTTGYYWPTFHKDAKNNTQYCDRY